MIFFCRYLVFEVYFSPHQRNIVCEYKLHGKSIMFTLFWYWCWKNLLFNVKLKLINFNFSQLHEHIFRSSRTQMSFKTSALKSFANVTGNHLCWSLFLKNLQAEGLQLHIKRLQYRCFLVKFANVLRTPFLTEHLRWLLLHLR